MTETTRGLANRIEDLPWSCIAAQLTEVGWANAGVLLTNDECSNAISLYDKDVLFRSRVVMERHNFGIGEYAYFAERLPAFVATLRTTIYAYLATISNSWAQSLECAERYPENLHDYLAACRVAGQMKPTPLLLRYRRDGFNCLHRDLYGELQFPIQAMVVLSEFGSDFEGGEFLLVENRARQQSRGTVLNPRRGELILFAGNERPVQGKRGLMRASVRHGVSRVTIGERYALGIIFHNAA